MFRKIILALLVSAVLVGVPACMEDFEALERERKAQEDKDMQAFKVLNEARQYMKQYPEEFKDIVDRFQKVINQHPNSSAAEEAKREIERIKNHPRYTEDR